MDNTAKLWDVETGTELCTLLGHTAEIVSLCFNTAGDQIITGSFDHDSKIWDVRSGRCIHTLSGHRGEVSSTQFNYSGGLCVSGSIDRTCRIWEVGSGRCLSVRQGHSDEVLDVAFDATGNKIVSARCDAANAQWAVLPLVLRERWEMKSLANLPGNEHAASEWELRNSVEMLLKLWPDAFLLVQRVQGLVTPPLCALTLACVPAAARTALRGCTIR
mmetsp:Transcript_61890/g.195578  ORF Transcript_61890/g.195578 Transcript_61890/m.195578 type:complete len:217 (+) Transcript_61890:836-1486(+)